MSLTQINKAGLDEIALDHVFTIGASGSSAYTFQGEGLTGTVNNPTLYLTRGKTYRFENGSGGHPIRIQSTSGASGTAYNTGVTNNAGSGTVIVEVQHDAPDVLYYQCTSHAAMNGILYITGALADGGVTTAKIAADAVTGAKIADDAINSEHYTDGSIDTAHIADSQVTNAKLADNAVSTARIADGAVNANKLGSAVVTTAKIEDNAVTSAKIANEAVTLAKLPHGTSSNDGKFLRANNGADPTFETVSGTTINNNADNKVITGSNTANTLDAESDLIYNGSQLLVNTSTPAAFTSRKLSVANTGSGDTAAIEIRSATNGSGRLYFTDSTSSGDAGSYAGKVFYDHTDDHMGFFTGGSTSTPSEKVKIYANGNVDVVDGNLALASGHGIDFSATSNETGSTTELLDDYERGNFSPTWLFSPNNSTGTTYNSNEGTYVKVGRMVYFTLHLWLSNKGSVTGAGYAQVQGLPFAVDGNGGFGVIAYYDNFGSYNPAVARVTPSEQIYIAQHNSGGYSQDLQLTHMNNSSRIYVGGCYSTTA